MPRYMTFQALGVVVFCAGMMLSLMHSEYAIWVTTAAAAIVGYSVRERYLFKHREPEDRNT